MLRNIVFGLFVVIILTFLINGHKSIHDDYINKSDVFLIDGVGKDQKINFKFDYSQIRYLTVDDFLKELRLRFNEEDEYVKRVIREHDFQLLKKEMHQYIDDFIEFENVYDWLSYRKMILMGYHLKDVYYEKANKILSDLGNLKYVSFENNLYVLSGGKVEMAFLKNNIEGLVDYVSSCELNFDVLDYYDLSINYKNSQSASDYKAFNCKNEREIIQKIDDGYFYYKKISDFQVFNIMDSFKNNIKNGIKGYEYKIGSDLIYLFLNVLLISFIWVFIDMMILKMENIRKSDKLLK